MNIRDVLEPNVASLYYRGQDRRLEPVIITLEQQIALSTAMSLKRIADTLESIPKRSANMADPVFVKLKP